MTRYLCISVTLLDPLFHGKADDDEPEWPPSPMRLFQALLAGSRTGCRNNEWSEAKDGAFRWLERRQPPIIVGPTPRRAAPYKLAIPNNDADKKFDRQDRLTSKVVRPQWMLNGASDSLVGGMLHYLWEISQGEWAEASKSAEILCRDARYLSALGWGIDQAIADGRILTETEAAGLPGRRWRPHRTHQPGQRGLRTPIIGSLEDLYAVYISFTSRIDGERFNPQIEFSQFDRVTYLSSTSLPVRSYSAFELPDGVAFRQEEVVAVAAMLRSLACQCAKFDSHEFPGGSELYVAGHITRTPQLRNEPTPPRFSYWPLPTIGHRHADGMIRRLIVAEPFGGNGSHAQWASERLRSQTLRDHNGNGRGVLLDLWRDSSDAMLKLYTGESRTWISVTPVVLPGFDDGKHVKAKRLFLKAAAQAEIPIEAIESLVLRKAPYWPGAQHPRYYLVPDYLRGLPMWHAAMRLRDAVVGPLAIGAGRHVGLGLFATEDERSSRPR